ncbi:hypothetical protein BGZ98_007178 [Dissophora globulifera]|nr:hypothetical protein BGZ98_007178 [Dissophora globulifera]
MGSRDSPAKIKIVQQPLHARMCGFGEKDRRPIDPPPIVQLIVEDDPHYNEFKAPPKSIRLIKPKKKRSKRLGVKKVRQPSKKVIAAATHAEVESATAIASMIDVKIKTEGCEGGSNNSHESGDEGYKEEHDGDEQQELDELDDEHGNSDNDELSTTDAAAVQRGTSQSGKQTRSRSPSTAPGESKRGSLKNEEPLDDIKMPTPQPQLRSQTRLRPDRHGQPARATYVKDTLQTVKKHTRSGEELPRGMARVVTSSVSAPIPAEIEEENSDSEQEWPRYEGGGEALRQDPLYVLHVSLWSEDGTEVRSMITTPGKTEPPKLTRILMGTLVVSPILLNNEHGEPGWYFSFPDLSIRTEGVYTLKFSMMRFSSDPEGSQISNIVAEEVSQPFTVYSAKKFPGMTESTELSKAFAKQGLKIPVRNDIRIRKIADKE